MATGMLPPDVPNPATASTAVKARWYELIDESIIACLPDVDATGHYGMLMEPEEIAMGVRQKWLEEFGKDADARIAPGTRRLTH